MGVTVLASRSAPPSDGGVEFYDIDVRDAAAVRALIHDTSPDFIYHLAGISSIGTAKANPELTYEVNVLGAYNVFEAAMNQAAPVRILNVSTSQVYAPSASPLKEESPTNPFGPYASSKAIAEALACHHCPQSSVGIITARAFNHTGPGQPADFVLSSIAKQFAEIESGSRSPTLTLGNIHVKRDFTDVRDVVRAYVSLLHHGTPWRIYNVCSGVAISVEEVVMIFQRLTGIEVSIEIDPDRLRSNDVPEICGNCGKLRCETGWTPQIELSKTLEDMLRFWRSKCLGSIEKSMDASRV
jgi:GDP-4-dehydro-6-deoxy-D-mannose reductase